MVQCYTLSQAAQVTGLEECEILFFEQVFREFLTIPQPAPGRMDLTRDHLDILCRVKRLIHEDGRSLEEVRRELRDALSASRDAAAPAYVLAAAPRIETVSSRRAEVIAVTGGRSGVGKTFLTVNLALAFALAGRRVAIFDQDFELASVEHLLGLSPRKRVEPAGRATLDGLVTKGPFGIQVLSGARGIREVAGLGAGARRTVLRQLDQLEHEVDVLLIDTGAGINGDVLRLAAFADQILVATTPQITTAADSYSLIKILYQVNPELQVGLAVNMVQTAWQGHSAFLRIQQAVHKHLRRNVADLGSVVFDPHVTVACQLRRPLLREYPNCEAFRCVRDLAERLLPQEAPAPESAEEAFEGLMGALRRAVVGV